MRSKNSVDHVWIFAANFFRFFEGGASMMMRLPARSVNGPASSTFPCRFSGSSLARCAGR